jgi:hypothetical protein
LNTSSVSGDEEHRIKQGKQIGGWTGGIAVGATGALVGAKVLGGLGTLAGPIGTLVGAALGAVLGAALGGIIGGAGAEDGVSTEQVNDLALSAATYTVEGEDGK